jgi:hypothetical protein
MIFVLKTLASCRKGKENEQRKQAGKMQKAGWSAKAFQSIA